MHHWVVHCSGPDCVACAVAPSMALPPSWLYLAVHDVNGEPAVQEAFCHADCLLRWAAHLPPREDTPEPTGLFDQGLGDVD